VEWPSTVSVWVLSNPRKTAITPQMLRQLGIQHTLYENPDWDWPTDHPELQVARRQRPAIRDYALRQYRAFRGHQEILRQSNTSYTLVFEDDAILADGVAIDEAVMHLSMAYRFLFTGGYDAVSFHARKPSPFKNSRTRAGRVYSELSPIVQTGTGHQYFLQPPAYYGYDGKYKNFEFRWHEGCLAYMVSGAGRQKWLQAGHGAGMPCDLFLANELHTLVMEQSLFHHGEAYGSLISGNSRTE